MLSSVSLKQQTLHSLCPTAPGNHICLSPCIYLNFLEIELHKRSSFLSGFFHLIWGFQGAPSSEYIIDISFLGAGAPGQTSYHWAPAPAPACFIPLDAEYFTVCVLPQLVYSFMVNRLPGCFCHSATMNRAARNIHVQVFLLLSPSSGICNLWPGVEFQVLKFWLAWVTTQVLLSTEAALFYMSPLAINENSSVSISSRCLLAFSFHPKSQPSSRMKKNATALFISIALM